MSRNYRNDSRPTSSQYYNEQLQDFQRRDQDENELAKQILEQIHQRKFTVPQPYTFEERDNQENKKKSIRWKRLQDDLQSAENLQQEVQVQQFHARPVPLHVKIPLLRAITHSKEQRRENLKNAFARYQQERIQPFSFDQRDAEMRARKEMQVALALEQEALLKAVQFKAKDVPINNRIELLHAYTASRDRERKERIEEQFKNKIADDENRQIRFPRTMNQALLYKAKLERLKSAKTYEEEQFCTFKPEINTKLPSHIREFLGLATQSGKAKKSELESLPKIESQQSTIPQSPKFIKIKKKPKDSSYLDSNIPPSSSTLKRKSHDSQAHEDENAESKAQQERQLCHKSSVQEATSQVQDAEADVQLSEDKPEQSQIQIESAEVMKDRDTLSLAELEKAHKQIPHPTKEQIGYLLQRRAADDEEFQKRKEQKQKLKDKEYQERTLKKKQASQQEDKERQQKLDELTQGKTGKLKESLQSGSHSSKILQAYLKKQLLSKGETSPLFADLLGAGVMAGEDSLKAVEGEEKPQSNEQKLELEKEGSIQAVEQGSQQENVQDQVQSQHDQDKDEEPLLSEKSLETDQQNLEQKSEEIEEKEPENEKEGESVRIDEQAATSVDMQEADQSPEGNIQNDNQKSQVDSQADQNDGGQPEDKHIPEEQEVEAEEQQVTDSQISNVNKENEKADLSVQDKEEAEGNQIEGQTSLQESYGETFEDGGTKSQVEEDEEPIVKEPEEIEEERNEDASVLPQKGKSIYQEGDALILKQLITNDQSQSVMREVLINAKKSEDLYIDKEFPAELSSLSKNKATMDRAKTFIWKRPKELWNSASFAIFEDTIEPNDVKQGALGDCYLLSSLSALAEHDFLIKRLFQIRDVNIQGIYCVWLCDDGEWRAIIVDDQLPCSNPQQLAFSGANGLELWVPLIEKAFAKIHGAYYKIEGGQTVEAIKDLTGAPGKTINHDQIQEDELWQTLDQCIKKQFILTCGSKQQEKNEELNIKGTTEGVTGQGIVQGHAYSILDAQVVNDNERILQIRNPWGTVEWTGDWSDKSNKWTSEMKEKLKWTDIDDGIFWIPIADYMHNYDVTCVNFLNPDYYYSWCKIQTKTATITFNITEDTHGYIQLTQRDKRTFENDDSIKEEYVYGSLSLACCQLEAGKPKTFIGEAYEFGRDLFIEANFVAGSYVILANLSTVNENNQLPFVVSIYASKPVALDDKPCEDEKQIDSYLNTMIKIKPKPADVKFLDQEKLVCVYEQRLAHFLCTVFENNSSHQCLTYNATMKESQHLAICLPQTNINDYTINVPGGTIDIVKLRILPTGRGAYSMGGGGISYNLKVIMTNEQFIDFAKTNEQNVQQLADQGQKVEAWQYLCWHPQSGILFLAFDNQTEKNCKIECQLSLKNLKGVGFDENAPISITLAKGEKCSYRYEAGQGELSYSIAKLTY